MKLMTCKNMMLTDVVGASLTDESLATFNLAELAVPRVQPLRVMQLMLQTGYLTLDREDMQGGMSYYRLRFPNGEVRSSFETGLLTAYNQDTDPYAYVFELGRAAGMGDTEQMIELLREFFAGLSYDIQVKQEKYYQSIVYTIFRMCGMEMQAEVTTNIGRIDGVLDTEQHLYIIEFKLDKTAVEAVRQIDMQKYAEKYLCPAQAKGQTVHALGINFSYEAGIRNITDWQEKILAERDV